MFLLLLALACPPDPKDTSPDPSGDTAPDTGSDDTGEGPPPDPLPALEGALTAENSAGRHGAFFLPDGYNVAPLPLFLAYHGSGGEGSQMVGALRDMAMEWRFGVVAPDSRVDPGGQYNWEVATSQGPFTEDIYHAQACLEEVLAMEGVAMDEAHLLAGGFSGGGSSGPYLATNDERFTHCAVLHGGVFPGGLGENIIPCWFSTGEEDTVRSPEHVAGQADSMIAAGFPDVVMSVWPGGHNLGPEEQAALVAWWLEGTLPPTP